MSAALTLPPLPLAIHGDIIGQFISVLPSLSFSTPSTAVSDGAGTQEEYYWLFLASIVVPTRSSFAGRREGRKEGHGTHPTHIEGREGQSVCTTARKRGARGLRLPTGNIRFLDRDGTVPSLPTSLSPALSKQRGILSRRECRDSGARDDEDERPLYVIRTRA